MKILFLSGPVGPFFKVLRSQLEEIDIETHQVIFGKSDQLFALRKNLISYDQDIGYWRTFIKNYLIKNEFDAICLFGSSRPTHQIAINVANELDIKIFSFEEGYRRSGFITMEMGGNNSQSPIAKDFNFDNLMRRYPNESLKINSFRWLMLYAFIQYAYRSLSEKKREKSLYHRHLHHPFKEIRLWIGHYATKKIRSLHELNLIKKLKSQKYHLVALQTQGDMQMTAENANLWSNELLIKSSIQKFYQSQVGGSLVFKLHPLCQSSPLLIKLIENCSRKYQVRQRVHVVLNHSLNDLFKNATGFITINSSSGLSALNYKVPVLALGKSIYRHPEIVECGTYEKDIERFFKVKRVFDYKTINDFLQRVKKNALISGDFYHSKYQHITGLNCIGVIKNELSNSNSDLQHLKDKAYA